MDNSIWLNKLSHQVSLQSQILKFFEDWSSSEFVEENVLVIGTF